MATVNGLTRYCPSWCRRLGFSELLIHFLWGKWSPKSVGIPKQSFWKFLDLKPNSQSTKVSKAAGRCLVGFLKLWLQNFYACLPGDLKIPLVAYWNHWIGGCFQKSGLKCCRNLCAVCCTTVGVPGSTGNVRQFRINYVWLIPYHYGFVVAFSEVLYLSHEKAKCFSHRGPFCVVKWQRSAGSLPCCWRLNRQLVLLFPEKPGLHMEFIGLVLPDPCPEGRPALGADSAWPQHCSSFQLQH